MYSTRSTSRHIMTTIILHTKDDAEVPSVYHSSGDKVKKIDMTMGAAETTPVKTAEGETIEKTTEGETIEKTTTKTDAKTSAKTTPSMEKLFDEMTAPSRECLGDELRLTVAKYNADVVKSVYGEVRRIMTDNAYLGIDYLLLCRDGRVLTLRSTIVIHDGVTDKAMDLIIALLVGQKIKVTSTEMNHGTRFELTF